VGAGDRNFVGIRNGATAQGGKGATGRVAFLVPLLGGARGGFYVED